MSWRRVPSDLRCVTNIIYIYRSEYRKLLVDCAKLPLRDYQKKLELFTWHVETVLRNTGRSIDGPVVPAG